MLHNFSKQDSVILGELTVGGQTVASTCNLVRGDTLFALKVGWNAEFASGSPGIWSRTASASVRFSSVSPAAQIDSCAKSGSHLESLWPRRRQMADIVYTWSYSATMLSSLRQQVRIARTRTAEWFKSASNLISAAEPSNPFQRKNLVLPGPDHADQEPVAAKVPIAGHKRVVLRHCCQRKPVVKVLPQLSSRSENVGVAARGVCEIVVVTEGPAPFVVRWSFGTIT